MTPHDLRLHDSVTLWIYIQMWLRMHWRIDLSDFWAGLRNDEGNDTRRCCVYFTAVAVSRTVRIMSKWSRLKVQQTAKPKVLREYIPRLQPQEQGRRLPSIWAGACCSCRVHRCEDSKWLKFWKFQRLSRNKNVQLTANEDLLENKKHLCDQHVLRTANSLLSKW